MLLARPLLLPLLLPSAPPRTPAPLLLASTGEVGTKLARAQALEAALKLAVDEEDYTEAATLRDELASLGMESELAVLQANSEFYRSFSEGDFKAMEKLWAPEGLVTCVHPAHAPLSDREAIIESWRQIFEGGNDFSISATGVQCNVQGTLAYVSCTEVVGKQKMAAINVFTAQPDGSWRMCVHHAGPIMV